MHNARCLSCGSGLTVRRDEAPMRLYACVRCAGGRGARECTRCGTRFYGRPDDSCRVCVEDALAEKGIFPGKGWKGPV